MIRFITMNPGLEWSPRIPDNLRLLFRPVATTAPDAALIAEVSLFAMGFSRARDLARRIVETYRLCSEQLSYQTHYEYGMRAVKTVIDAIARFKNSHPGHGEEEIVHRVMLDVNQAKFVASDLPAFKGIVDDLFAGVVPVTVDRSDLREAAATKCKEFNLQPTDWFIDKVVQLYDLVLVRHGIMIIGKYMYR